MNERYDAAVIGGGFYGCMIALHLRRYYPRVVLIERERDLMQRASYANQARVHNGYHYPRSLLTALRSRVNFPRFVSEFNDCIDNRFDKYYAIARQFSKVTAQHFRNLCQRIGAPLAEAPPHVVRLFNPDLVESVFRVQEYAFDAVKLKQTMARRLAQRQVAVRFDATVQRVEAASAGQILLHVEEAGQSLALLADRAFNCTYSQINTLLCASHLRPLPLKHELTEMALVQPPEQLKQLGVTVMCGPFFSFMPFPARGLHTLSHVRYTPHRSWRDGDGSCSALALECRQQPPKSQFSLMLRDAVRFLPAMADCQQVDSLWEVKTVLAASERDDSRPILLQTDLGLDNFACIMAAKIDNVFDVIDAIDGQCLPRQAA